MKPIRLEFSGLNSYVDNQVINFEELTSKGLFGIFGDTGSGKSTIVDAIIIAMYGNISKSMRQHINSECNNAYVHYEFEIGSENFKRRYSISRQFQNSKEYNMNTSKAKLEEVYNNGDTRIIADNIEDVNKNIIHIVGLTESDFTKSVVLPQGKFDEFLRLTGSERRYMLERIFNLEEYGTKLIKKVKIKKNKEIENLNDINSKLKQYDGVTEELYDKVCKSLELLKIFGEKKSISLRQEQQLYEEQKEILDLQQKLEKLEYRKKDLNTKDKDIKYKTTQLKNAINADKIQPHIYGIQELEKSIKEDKSSIEVLNKRLNILNQELVITNNKYEESYNNKNSKMPRLSEDRIRFQRALKLEGDVQQIDEDLKLTKETILQLEDDKNYFESLKNGFEIKRDKLLKTITELEIKINKLNIDVDLKQKIFLAYEHEKKLKVLEEQKKNTEKILLEKSDILDKVNLKSKYVQRDKGVIIDKLNIAKDHYNVILKKYPGKIKDILILTEHICDLKSKVQILKEEEKKRALIQEELNIILENKYKFEREINSTRDKLSSLENNIHYINKDLDKLKYLNLAKYLKKDLKDNMPCPVCGSRNYQVESEVYDEKIQFTTENLEKLKNERDSLISNLEDLNCKNSGHIEVEKLRIKELEELKLKLGQVKSTELSKKLDSEVRSLQVLKENVDRWEHDKESTQEKINRLSEEKYKIDIEEAQLIASINNNKLLISKIKDELTYLKSTYKNQNEKYIGLKSSIKIFDLESKVEEINKNELFIEEINKSYHKISKEKELVEESIRSYDNKLHATELELMKNKEQYIEKKRVREQKYSEIITITNGNSSIDKLIEIQEEINKIEKIENDNKIKLDRQRLDLEKYVAEKYNIEGRLKKAEEQHKVQCDTLNQLLSDNKFDSIYSVKRSLLEPDYTRKLGDEISEYEEEQRLLTIKITGLKDTLSGRRVSKEDIEGIKDKIYNLKVETEQIQKDIGAQENKLGSIKNSLENINILKKEFHNIKKKVNLLAELDNLIQENKLVEYVASNKLREICNGASKVLNNLTNGRYSLGINNNLDFIIIDNFAARRVRDIDTLSGGEVFLTSLSLAIALSTQIQLNGKSPLGFFFIDEGFGALDNRLLERVMESLEKLESNNISIGIISHIESLKSRVPIKLIVNKDKNMNKSNLRIEYS